MISFGFLPGIQLSFWCCLGKNFLNFQKKTLLLKWSNRSSERWNLEGTIFFVFCGNFFQKWVLLVPWNQSDRVNRQLIFGFVVYYSDHEELIVKILKSLLVHEGMNRYDELYWMIGKFLLVNFAFIPTASLRILYKLIFGHSKRGLFLKLKFF